MFIKFSPLTPAQWDISDTALSFIGEYPCAPLTCHIPFNNLHIGRSPKFVYPSLPRGKLAVLNSLLKGFFKVKSLGSANDILGLVTSIARGTRLAIFDIDLLKSPLCSTGTAVLSLLVVICKEVEISPLIMLAFQIIPQMRIILIFPLNY